MLSSERGKEFSRRLRETKSKPEARAIEVNFSVTQRTLEEFRDDWEPPVQRGDER